MLALTQATLANREKALLSHVFSMAIRWGIVTDNPCRDVKRLTEKRRDRYVTDIEYWRICRLAPKHIKNIIRLAYLTGLRQTDILKIKLDDIKSDGLFVMISKTQKKILIEWSKRLQAVVKSAKKFSELKESPYLFAPARKKRKEGRFTEYGFQTVWQKLMVKALDEGIITERFKFRDIRRKTATDIEQLYDREQARKLLGHTDQKTTDIYISGVRRVKPLN